MRKIRISAILSAIFAAAPCAGFAAYPVYQGYNNQPAYQPQPQYQQQVQYPQPAYGQGYQQPVYQQPAAAGVQYLPQNQVRGAVAAQPTRVTGPLPRVGSAATNAGRQYYQPADYDRLADSGLYLGLSVGYSTAVSGGMKADYVNQANSYYVPGSFTESQYLSDSVMPLQVSLGAAINNDVRVDFSYTRYRNIAYSDIADTSDGMGGYIEAQATGGAISANVTSINVYYNIDSYTGMLAGGGLRPYVGAGLGISLNTISDYVIYDGTFYPEVPDGTPSPGGQLTAISDIYAYHAGGTTEQLAYMLEGGLTTELEGGLKLDFFVRYAQFGKVQSSGSIVVSQTEWLGTGAGQIGVDPDAEAPAPYDSVFHYTNWYESGNFGTIDLGIRLRLQF
ncbi:MAG: hypothetical protein LBJ18_04090 [Rickettsiales bacterium]|nr:hypothetical protein [Rickettsiales bacterium]